MLKDNSGKLICEKVKQVVNTDGQAYILTTDGNVYEILQNELKHLPCDKTLKQISAGNSFLSFLSNQDELFGYKEERASEVFIMETSMQKLEIFELQHIQKHIPKEPIRFIKACYQSNFVVMEDNSIYSYDYDNYYVLGREGPREIPAQVKGDLTKDEKIIKIENCFATVIYLSENGKVFGHGYRVHGELATDQDTTSDTRYPTRIEFFKKNHIVDIAGGVFHVLWLDINGDLYASGETDHKQLGPYLSGWTVLPKIISNNVKWIYATSNTSVIFKSNELIIYGGRSNQNYIEKDMKDIQSITGVAVTNNRNYYLFKYKDFNMKKIFEKDCFDFYFKFK